MTSSVRLSRPLHRRCAQCRRVQEVRLHALYHVVVPNKGGGTRRDGGYDCRFCGTANIIPVGEMPQGLVLRLPSREQIIAASVAREPAAPDEPPALVPAPSVPQSPPAPAKPVRSAAPAPAPVWIVGVKAQAALLDGFGRASRDPGGTCTAFLRASDGALVPIDARNQIDDGDILRWLDRSGCELLVLGGSEPDGRRWKAVFHPIAGAATLVIEARDP
ncbi:MAG: hypothetical protein JWO65_1684 [Sphingomonas bacterium]|jgi:hypothetical protein|nr:hypothetical protein [Sphingomonas bacterium]